MSRNHLEADIAEADLTVTPPPAGGGWVKIEIGPRQLRHLVWLCNLHLRVGSNEPAMALTRRVLRRLDPTEE